MLLIADVPSSASFKASTHHRGDGRRTPISKNGSSPSSLATRAFIFGDLWPYDPAPETAEPGLQASYGLFIDGGYRAAQSGKTFATINPATGDKLADVALAGEADVDAAYRAAQHAFDTVWGKMPGQERGKYLFRIARLLQDRAREFAVAETLDGGKPIKESRDFDVPAAAAHFFYHAGWRTSSTTPFPARAAPTRSGWSGRSSRGTFRC